jgi:hypothetical protein
MPPDRRAKKSLVNHVKGSSFYQYNTDFKDSYTEFETTVFIIDGALAALDNIRASLAFLHAYPFSCTMGEEWASVGKRRNCSGRDSLDFDGRVFFLLSFNGFSLGLLPRWSLPTVNFLLAGGDKDPALFLSLVPAVESRLEDPLSEPNCELDKISSRPSAATALYAKSSDGRRTLSSAATVLCTKSSDGRRALSSTMSKSEAIINLLSKIKARHSLSGETAMLFTS